MDDSDLFNQAFEDLDEIEEPIPLKEEPKTNSLAVDKVVPTIQSNAYDVSTRNQLKSNVNVNSLPNRNISQPSYRLPNQYSVSQDIDKKKSQLWSNEDFHIKDLKQNTNQPSYGYVGNTQNIIYVNNEGVVLSSTPNYFDYARNPVLFTSSNNDQSTFITTADQDEENADIEDELGHAETFNEYWPSKLKIGRRHPDPVVETSSLASVEQPNISYHLSLPHQIIEHGLISSLQLEAVIYACQRHRVFLASGFRAGYLIGDGAGVGKGRTIAAVIYENWLRGRRKHIWLSVSSDLRIDSERDLNDIGAGEIKVYALNKFRYNRINSRENGNVREGVIYSTYSSLISESRSGFSRLRQLLNWCSADFDGCIILDECHRAKNLCPVGSAKPTKTGLAVLELQERLPKARIVYSSATGATEPKNMAYMVRLGLWGQKTQFSRFDDFISAVERRGVGAMELVAMEMKLRGMYIARQLSFHGVSFNIEQIPIDREFILMYDEAVKFWTLTKKAFAQAVQLLRLQHRSKQIWALFWAAHQRFFKYLCISAKVKYCVEIAKKAVRSGQCVVIGLQSTGESRTLEALGGFDSNRKLSSFISTARGVVTSLIEKNFPSIDENTSKGWHFDTYILFS